MSGEIITAVHTQIGLLDRMNVLAHELANINTHGHKEVKMNFINYLSPNQDENTDGLSFAYEHGTLINFEPGPFESTGNPLDCMISEESGFFVVRDKNGTNKYTRLGHFVLDDANTLVTISNEPVLSQGGEPIALPQGAEMPISISRNGTISAIVGGKRQDVGQLGVVTFADLNALEKTENTYFLTDQQPIPPDTLNILQGGLEGSNVNPVEKLTQLIELNRTFGLIQNVIASHSDSRDEALSLLGSSMNA